MAMKQAEFVSGYKTSDGVVHNSSITAADHQDRLNLIEVIGGSKPYTAVGIADELLKRYTLRERDYYVEPSEEMPSGNYGQPSASTGYHEDELPPIKINPVRALPDDDDDVPF